MNKEIDKRVIDKSFHEGYEVDTVTIQESDYEYLKEQAELVQELEREVEGREKFELGTTANLKILREQNKRYREAIEKALSIATPSTMYSSDCSDVEVILREALEESE